MFKSTTLLAAAALALTLGSCTSTNSSDYGSNPSANQSSPTGKIGDSDVTGNEPKTDTTGAIGNSDTSGNNNTQKPGAANSTGTSTSNER